MTFVEELKRRNVVRVGIAYALAAWVLLQAADFVLQVIDAPGWILQVFVLVAAIGLPVVLIFAWVFEMTPEGIKRESQIDRSHSITPQTGRKLDRVIIVFLALAVIGLLVERFAGRGEPTAPQPAADSAAAPADEPATAPSISARSVAVLPFLALSSGPDDEYFADGLTEEILNALAQLPELLVTARTSSFHFKGQDLPVQDIAAQLGVGHIVEGSVRRAGERLRVTAQLIRAADGFHLWSENYDRSTEDAIAVQENIAEKIATAMDVVMNESTRERMRRAGLRDVEAFIAMQKGGEFYERAHGDADQLGNLRQANTYFEFVQQRVPDYPLAYQLHSDLYVHILLTQADGDILPGVSESELDHAERRAIADYQAAVNYARTPQERNNADLDLAFLASDWRGMPARIERFAAERGCSQSSWIDNAAIPFGYAAPLVPRQTEFRICDPMRSTEWMSEARALLWAGDPAAAIALARQGVAVAPGEWLQLTLINALAASGEFETARHEIALGLQHPSNGSAMRAMLAAAQGDREAARVAFASEFDSPNANSIWKLVYYAWTGDLESANRMAASTDAYAFAGPSLATSILWCSCGAPFDLAATPNFARLVEDAGFDWPPPTVIRFPLKDW